jgi:hypothetical protein
LCDETVRSPWSTLVQKHKHKHIKGILTRNKHLNSCKELKNIVRSFLVSLKKEIISYIYLVIFYFGYASTCIIVFIFVLLFFLFLSFATSVLYNNPSHLYLFLNHLSCLPLKLPLTENYLVL